MTIPMIKKILKIIIFNVMTLGDIQQLQNVMGCVYVKCPEKRVVDVYSSTLLALRRGWGGKICKKKHYVTFE